MVIRAFLSAQSIEAEHTTLLSTSALVSNFHIPFFSLTTVLYKWTLSFGPIA